MASDSAEGSVGVAPGSATAEAKRLLRLRSLLVDAADDAASKSWLPAVQRLGEAATATVAAVNQRLGELVSLTPEGRPPPHSPSAAAAATLPFRGVLADASLRPDPACHLFGASTAAAVA